LALIATIGVRTRRVLKSAGVKKSKRTLELLGCSPEYFQQYIISQFKEGMTLDNYGRKKGQWSIDHIIPCAAFDIKKETDRRVCFHYTNLRPMWHSDNVSKGSHYKGEIYHHEGNKKIILPL
jgi:hypothetical protein